MRDEFYMSRALQLAALGIGQVSPNPPVGCVICHGGQIIGEGYHQRYGGPHAEVNAIESVDDKSLLSSSTVYVSLEPCAHHGKTPPCADLLVKHQVKRVFIAVLDPNPKVSGKGVAMLREAGIEVEVGLLEEEARETNKRFMMTFQHKRPYVILKWAQTADKFIARADYDSKWISNVYSRQLVHKWRSEEDAILVGTNTARYDDPELTTREWVGRNAVRVVLDRGLTLPASLKLFDGKSRTICFTEEASDGRTAEMITRSSITVPGVLSELARLHIQSIIVEGGSQLLQSFIDQNLWDEARVFTSEKSFGEGITAPTLTNAAVKRESVANDSLEYFINAQPG